MSRGVALHSAWQLHSVGLGGSGEVDHLAVNEEHGFIIIRHIGMHQGAVPVPLDMPLLAMDLPPFCFIRIRSLWILRAFSPVAEAVEMFNEADSLFVVDHVHE